MARKILIVDDDPNALRLVSYAFEAEGYEVATASTGAEALARLGSQRPDLVVLDVMMPDMSGLEVCERIRGDPAMARLPILMLSARGLVADRVTGLRSGADDYLPKPADTSELIARAEALLTRASYTAVSAAQVLAFLGAKGGTGTTTAAVNVAVHLAGQGKVVSLVELRPGPGSASSLLKLQPVHDLGTLLATPAAQIGEALPSHLVPHSSGLRLLAAPQAVEQPCEITAEWVDALISALTEDADYVILDLPAAWSAANQAAVRRARYTALVCEPEPVSLSCAKTMLATLQRWGVMGDLVGLLIVSRGLIISPMPLPTMRAAVPVGVVGVIPPTADAGLAAARDGTPLVTLQPQHVAVSAMKELALRLTADRIRPLA